MQLEKKSDDVAEFRVECLKEEFRKRGCERGPEAKAISDETANQKNIAIGTIFEFTRLPTIGTETRKFD